MIAGELERRPAWQVALLWLGLRAAHAAFAPHSERGLYFVWGVGIALLLAWLTLPWLYAASAKYRLPHAPADGARGWYVGGGLVVATGLLARGPLPSTALVVDGQGIAASVPESVPPHTTKVALRYRPPFALGFAVAAAALAVCLVLGAKPGARFRRWR